MRKNNLIRRKATDERQAEVAKLQQKARIRIIQIDGKKQRVRMYRCPSPMDASPLGSMAKLKGMRGGSR